MPSTKRSATLTVLSAILLAAVPGIGLQAFDDPAGPTADAAVIDIRNSKMPVAGVLTGGQPTEAALAAAAAAGYRTVVNLRSEAEMAELEETEGWDESAAVAALGMDYVFIPMAGAAGLTVDNARGLADVLARPEGYPMMIHCASGNRAGALLALKAFHVDGRNADAALDLGLAAGLTKLEEAVRDHLASASAEGWLCRNDLEIRCGDGSCAAQTGDGFTPMSVSVDTSGALSVCAYSGCWEGTGTVLRSGEFLVVIGRDLAFSTSPDSASAAQDVVIAIDRRDRVATLKVGEFAHPLLCEHRSGVL